VDFMKADAFSHRMPPVQYMKHRLPRSDSRLERTNRGNSANVRILTSVAAIGPSKCPRAYSFEHRTSSSTVSSAHHLSEKTHITCHERRRRHSHNSGKLRTRG
jgi:hypothetical protein